MRRTRYLVRNEAWLLDEFQEWARNHIHAQARPLSELEWLALAQHHGLPTRLLDWSRSALVAAFFAVEAEKPKSDAVIYAYEAKQILPNKFLRQIHPFSHWSVIPFHPPQMSDRIVAQESVFTIHRSPTKAWEPEGLRRAVIKNEFCTKLKSRLYNIGVHSAALFPDLDGAAKTLAWLYATNVDQSHYRVPEDWLLKRLKDSDIHRIARKLIENNGKDARTYVAKVLNVYQRIGDKDDKAMWLRIVRAVEELLSGEQPDDAEVH